MGLDLFAVLGSTRALQLLETLLPQAGYAYDPARHAALRRAVMTLPATVWPRTRGYAGLAGLQALLAPVPDGAPAFMRSTAWQEKTLMAAQGYWTEQHGDAGRLEQQKPAPPPGPPHRRPPATWSRSRSSTRGSPGR